MKKQKKIKATPRNKPEALTNNEDIFFPQSIFDLTRVFQSATHIKVVWYLYTELAIQKNGSDFRVFINSIQKNFHKSKWIYRNTDKITEALSVTISIKKLLDILNIKFRTENYTRIRQILYDLQSEILAKGNINKAKY